VAPGGKITETNEDILHQSFIICVTTKYQIPRARHLVVLESCVPLKDWEDQGS
jgi:hypothetical protein